MHILDNIVSLASKVFKFPPAGESRGLHFIFKAFSRRVYFQLIEYQRNWKLAWLKDLNMHEEKFPLLI